MTTLIYLEFFENQGHSGPFRAKLSKKTAKRARVNPFDPFPQSKPTPDIHPEILVVVGDKKNRGFVNELLDETSPFASSPFTLRIPQPPPGASLRIARAAVVETIAKERDAARKEALIRESEIHAARIADQIRLLEEDEAQDDEESILAIFLAI